MNQKSLNIHPLTLSFRNRQSDLESCYQSRYFECNLMFLRVAMITAIVLLLFETLVYFLYYPKYLYVLFLLKILTIIPMFMIGFVCSFFRWFRRWYQFIAMFFVIAVGIYYNVAIVIVDTHHIFPFICALLVCYIFNYIFAKLSFFLSFISGWILFAITVVNILSLIEPLTSASYYTALIDVLIFNILGTIVSYTIDRGHRYEFFLEHELMVEKDNQQRINDKLHNSLNEIKVLRGILPICSFCKNIRNDEGYYEKIESYIHKHSGVDFTHTICDSCMKKHYPEEYEEIMLEKSGDLKI